jgi:ketosteroid isomerase-like protein
VYSGAVNDTLRSLDIQIDTAVSNGDAASLETILADDYLYTHANGNQQTKREYIDATASNATPPRRSLSEIEVELHGDVAITRGNLDVVHGNGRPTSFMRYVRVYRLNGGRWQPISHRTVYATDRNPQ